MGLLVLLKREEPRETSIKTHHNKVGERMIESVFTPRGKRNNQQISLHEGGIDPGKEGKFFPKGWYNRPLRSAQTISWAKNPSKAKTSETRFLPSKGIRGVVLTAEPRDCSRESTSLCSGGWDHAQEKNKRSPPCCSPQGRK